MIRFVLLLSVVGMLAACSGNPSDPSDPTADPGPLTNKDLMYKKGDTVVILVEDIETAASQYDTLVLFNIDEHERYDAWVWRRHGSTELVTEWIDSGYIRRSESTTGFLGTFGRLPSITGEMVLIDTVESKPWDVEQIQTISADTSITTPAGTFRCAVFQITMLSSGAPMYKNWIAYSPGNGVIKNTYTTIEYSGEEPLYRYRRTLCKRMFR